jgi:hypothetical protein
MKKLGMVLTAALAFCLTVALPALAAYPPTVQGEHGGRGGNQAAAGAAGATGGTAFTGANVSLWIVLLAVLAIAGVTALFISRRRALASK